MKIVTSYKYIVTVRSCCYHLVIQTIARLQSIFFSEWSSDRPITMITRSLWSPKHLDHSIPWSDDHRSLTRWLFCLIEWQSDHMIVWSQGDHLITKTIHLFPLAHHIWAFVWHSLLAKNSLKLVLQSL